MSDFAWSSILDGVTPAFVVLVLSYTLYRAMRVPKPVEGSRADPGSLPVMIRARITHCEFGCFVYEDEDERPGGSSR